MNLNLELLREKSACESGLAWYLSHGQPNTVEGCVSALLADPDPSTTLPYANWLLSNLLNEDDCLRYAIFAARQVLHIFETAYPEDNRPHLAIEAAENYLVTHSEADRDAARAAGNDAWDAERVARAAWTAALDAMATGDARAYAWATRADAWAAWAAGAAPRAAAWAARAAAGAAEGAEVAAAWAAGTAERAAAWAAWAAWATGAAPRAAAWAARAAAGAAAGAEGTAERVAGTAERVAGAAGAVAGDLMYRAIIEYGVTLI